MSIVLLGQNRFIDCDAVLGYRGQPLLRVRLRPFGVELATPPGMRSAHIQVDSAGHVNSSDPEARVVRDQKSFSIFWKGYAVVVATLLDEETAHVKIDLRPLGIKIYDDFQGLHIGSNAFSGNEIRGAATAIALSD